MVPPNQPKAEQAEEEEETFKCIIFSHKRGSRHSREKML